MEDSRVFRGSLALASMWRPWSEIGMDIYSVSRSEGERTLFCGKETRLYFSNIELTKSAPSQSDTSLRVEFNRWVSFSVGSYSRRTGSCVGQIAFLNRTIALISIYSGLKMSLICYELSCITSFKAQTSLSVKSWLQSDNIIGKRARRVRRYGNNDHS